MHWRLHYWTFIRLWLYRKSLEINNSWFEKTKKLYADPKAIQQIKFDGQLKNMDDINADGTESTFVLPILEKIKETRLKFLKLSISQN